jgi:hypothetical protein
VPTARAAIAAGRIGLRDRHQPNIRMTSQHQTGECLIDRGLAAKLIEPLGRSYPERLKAARAGEHFFHVGLDGRRYSRVPITAGSLSGTGGSRRSSGSAVRRSERSGARATRQ